MSTLSPKEAPPAQAIAICHSPSKLCSNKSVDCISYRKTGVVLTLAALRCYQLTLSLLMGPCCRYTPSCSNYAMEAVLKHGLWHGLWLAFRRLVRCHPWGGSGFDPVP